jgi:hypothetical protein
VLAFRAQGIIPLGPFILWLGAHDAYWRNSSAVVDAGALRIINAPS